jgi:cyclic dehypoxanthinyl futalosine synthase
VSAAPPPSSPRFTRITDDDALDLYRRLSIHQLGRLAFERCGGLHPEPYRTYVVDRNINYANVCTARCTFCNFYAQPGSDDAYILTHEQIGRKIEELVAIGGTQILMQGGLVPPDDHPRGHGLPFAWYVDLLRFIKRDYPGIHVHAFSPPEIWAFHRNFHMPLRDVLECLRDAGLDTIPGGGGEILVERVRRKIGRGKCSSDQWLTVMREAHALGMRTSCTMMFGHIETVAERIEHLRRLRELQDETGGFTAFIHWPFQPEGTALGRWKPLPIGDWGLEIGDWESATGARRPRTEDCLGFSESPISNLKSQIPNPKSPISNPQAQISRPIPDGKHLLLADAHEYLVMLALARLYLDNIPNIQSSWVTMGPKIGQLALFFGANDMGSVMMEENVVSAAGTTFRLNEAEIRRLITDAGWQPQQRDQHYRPIESRTTATPDANQC